jgi:hypothetical protein
MIEKVKRQKAGDEHYVNNREFTLALDTYSRECKQAEKDGVALPQMSRYLGECILKMSTRLANSPRFRNYSFKEEMISNGILAAVKYAHRFDGDRFDNGFAYVTQILFSHFIITIKSEKKKYETNLRLIQEAAVGLISVEGYESFIDEHARFIADQKLTDLEHSKEERNEDGKMGTRGFHLRSGYTKESREAYKGTPLIRDEDDDKKDE